jgi:hypothetical protein
MNKVVLLLAILGLSVVVPVMTPAASAIGNCSNGWNGVVVTQPSGRPFGVCCTPYTPMKCESYRLDIVPPPL